MKYVYRNIDSPNQAIIKGGGKISQLMLTPLQTETKINILLYKQGEEIFILKNTELFEGSTLDVFENTFSYDPSYQFAVKVLSGSVSMLLTLS
mgnify:CR=1 FL=1